MVTPAPHPSHPIKQSINTFCQPCLLNMSRIHLLSPSQLPPTQFRPPIYPFPSLASSKPCVFPAYSAYVIFKSAHHIMYILGSTVSMTSCYFLYTAPHAQGPSSASSVIYCSSPSHSVLRPHWPAFRSSDKASFAHEASPAAGMLSSPWTPTPLGFEARATS